jgi:putative hemolysin
LFELLTVAFLILLNGVFALSELAVVSSRRMRLKNMVEDRVPGARRALALHENPGRFLSHGLKVLALRIGLQIR